MVTTGTPCWSTKLLNAASTLGSLRGVRDRLEELLGGRIAIGMPPQVQADALLEFVVAEIGGDHCDDLPALAVGDRVERRIDLAILVIGWWMGRPTTSASVFIAPKPSPSAPTPILSSGRHSLPIR